MAERLYAGLSSGERDSRRREQLLAAGLEVFAGKGWAASTVHDICGVAGLSPRYFYDHAADREDLFAAVVAQIAADVESTVMAALTASDDPGERAEAVVEAIVGYFTADPRTIRVALMESLGTEEFRSQRRALLETFSALGARLMRPLRDGPTASRGVRRRLGLTAVVLTGGLVESLIAWEGDRSPASAAALVEHLAVLYASGAQL